MNAVAGPSFGLSRGAAFRAGGIGVGNRVAHHPPVHPELPRHPFYGPDAVLILAPDLLEQLHFLPPVQPASVPDPSGSETEYPALRFEQGGQIRVSKWANSE